MSADDARPAWLERCPGCGYDLRGTDLDDKPCPECGWRATEAERERLGWRREYVRRSLWAAPILLSFLAVAAALIQWMTIVTFGMVATRAGWIWAVLPVVVGAACVGPMVLTAKACDRRVAAAMWLRTFGWLLLPWFFAVGWKLLIGVVPDSIMAVVWFGSVLGYPVLVGLAAHCWGVHWRRLSRRFGIDVKGLREAGPVLIAVALALTIIILGWPMFLVSVV